MRRFLIATAACAVFVTAVMQAGYRLLDDNTAAWLMFALFFPVVVAMARYSQASRSTGIRSRSSASPRTRL